MRSRANGKPRVASLCLVAVLAAGTSCKRSPPSHPLLEARKSLTTKLRASPLGKEPFEPAPPEVFRSVQYPSPAGSLRAYLTPDPGDGQKHPAIIWITGGDCNSIGDVWSEAPAENEQTAAAYRKAGLVMMFPSQRGGNDNPGAREGFLGEVDDVIAAHAFLSRVSYVDPSRIYLGGHSTGGTLALLVAEAFDGFKGVFAFGPAADVRSYGEKSRLLPYDLSDPAESKVRSPAYWLDGVRSPTWVIEGDGGNIAALRAMKRMTRNGAVHLVEIPGASHFATLAPINAAIAAKLAALGPEESPSFTAEELSRAFAGVAHR